MMRVSILYGVTRTVLIVVRGFLAKNKYEQNFTLLTILQAK